ncbi:glycosyltransferase [uncultured Draconibacterium sp.]|uniref:glycosyltransferase n=1 Tax=uncultured Draconibacterium sp. TaxID=1573823 RepID=UPI0025DAB639|nr:glycosyltransferase [uncultured Draconibacterium sp.]
MLKGKDIICVSYTTWYGPYTKSTVQILSRLAKHNRLVFIEYPFTLKDVVTTLLGKTKVPLARMFGFKNRLKVLQTDVESEVYQLIAPPVFPVDFIKNEKIFKPFYRVNNLLYRWAIKQTMKKLDIKSPVVITAFNALYGLPLVGCLNEEMNVYYCYDGIETRRHGERIFKIDEDFSKAVDGIITTSDYLNIDKEKMNPNSYVVKNGVDYDLFISEAKTDLHSDRKRKIIGYIGSLDHRFDIDTMEYAIKQLSEVNFEFTGDLRNKLIKDRLDGYPNVKFSPPIAPHEVPALLASYDLGVIPYIVNEVNKNIYPLKINEYLAVGVSVVLTSFAKLPEFEQIVRFATDKEEFTRQLNEELSNDSKEKIAERKAFSSKNSWNNKADEFSEVLEQLLNKTKH